jgi:hypothetical protein
MSLGLKFFAGFMLIMIMYNTAAGLATQGMAFLMLVLGTAWEVDRIETEDKAEEEHKELKEEIRKLRSKMNSKIERAEDRMDDKIESIERPNRH